IKENLNVGKVGKETVSAQQYVLLPLWSTGSQDPQNTDADYAFDVKENENEVHVSPSESDKTDDKKHNEKAKRDAKEKSHVDLSTGVRDSRAEFEEFSSNSTNRVNAVSAPTNAARTNPTNNTNCFYIASPFDTAVNMPELEDIVYSDDEENIGVDADLSNLETNTFVSPIPTTRVYKDLPVTQIIGDLTLAPQTRSMTKMVKEQGFEDPDYLDKVYKVVKALYWFHQAPRASYETLANYLLENGFQRGKIDQTLFIKKQKGDILLVRVYVDDIIFGSTNKKLYVKSASTPIETKKPLLKDPDGEDMDVHIYRYLKGKPHLGLWYPKDSPFNLVAYSDSDYAGASLDRKSTTGCCQFLGCRLIAWQCKKQTVVATSSIEAEYVAAASCCAQVLWI
nr:hypothetical protein [Tanacetum cinerariifolium]